MAISQEDLQSQLTELLGGRPSSDEGMELARQILEDYQSGGPGPEEQSLESIRARDEDVKGALELARQRIMELRGPSRSEKLLALGRGLGASTKSGSIGETMSNVAGQMQPLAEEQRAFEAAQGKALSGVELALAQAMGPSTQAEFDIAKLRYAQEGRMAQEALKTIARGSAGGKGSTGSRTREAKIADLMNEWNYSRKDASALVDGFVDIQLTDIGRARLINEIDQTVTEVPLGSLADYADPDTGQVTTRKPTAKPGGSAVEGEIDTRTQQEKDADLFVTTAFAEGASVWDMTDWGTGPKSWLYNAVSIPSSLVGGPVAEQTIASRQGLMLASRDLAEALVDNPKKPVRLIELALEAAGLEPGIFDTGPMMQQRLIELDKYLYQKYEEFVKLDEDPNTPDDLREQASVNRELIGTYLRNLGVPQDERRRTLFVPVTPQDEKDYPDLPKSPPANSGFSQESWNALTPQQKARAIVLLQQVGGR